MKTVSMTLRRYWVRTDEGAAALQALYSAGITMAGLRVESSQVCLDVACERPVVDCIVYGAAAVARRIVEDEVGPDSDSFANGGGAHG